MLSIKEKEIELSNFEIQRRIENGETRFEKVWLKKQIIPIYNYIRKCIVAVLVIILTSSNSQIFSFWEALFVTFGLSFLAYLLSRVDFLKKISHRVFKKISPKMYLIWNFLKPKTRQRILNLNKTKAWMFYSKEEMFDFLEKHKKILSERELGWFERISMLEKSTVEDFMISFDSLDILHEKDLLTPLVIDELFKSRQSVFAVMNEADEDIVGIVRMEKIAEIAEDSKRVRTLMEREFFEVQMNKNALEVFEKMLKNGEKFAIVKNRQREFVGILEFERFLNKKF